MKFIDKYGFPVERIIGRPFINILRIILHTKKIIILKNGQKKQNWVLDNFDVTFPCIECGKPVTNIEGSSNCHDICRLEL